MHIAFIVSYLEERYGGPVTTVREVGCALSRMGHKVSCWTTAAPTATTCSAWPYEVHSFDAGWPFKWRRSRGFTRGLSQEIDSIDILHVNELWLFPVLAASRIAHAHGIPYVLRPAGSLDPWSLEQSSWKRIKKLAYLEVVGRRMIRQAACLHATSDREADGFRKLGYGGPASIIPNGVDINAFHPGDPQEAEVYWPWLRDRPIVLFLSRLSPTKGLDMLIPAWADIVRGGMHNDAMLVIAGPDFDDYGRVVQAMIERHGMSSHVQRIDLVTGARKAALLRRADVFVLPSYSENFGIVVVEALASGVPVVTTTRTPWAQLTQVDAGRYVPAESGELARATQELLSMSARQRQAMGRNGVELVRANYTWDKIAARYLALYDCILNRKPVPLHP